MSPEPTPGRPSTSPFKGAIANGSSAGLFTLPAAFRPSTNVYVPVDLCNATNGRLVIQPNRVVSVQAETDFANAQCFTSLDGSRSCRSAAWPTAPVPP